MTKTLSAHRATKALLPLAIVGAIGALTLAPSYAYAATETGAVKATYVGAGVGYNKVIDGHAAGTLKLKVEGDKVIETFCIDFDAEIAQSGTYLTKPWAASGASNVAKAADVALRHNQVPGKLAEPKAENTAAQLAIWKFTNGKDFSAVPNAAIVARANALVAAAGAQSEPTSSFVLTSSATVSGEGDAAKDTVVATVKTDQGAPVAGKSVTFTVGSQTLTGTTDKDGKATVTLDAPDAATTLKVSLATVLPAGSVLVPAGKQAMITTEDAPVSRLGQVVLPAAPAVKPTPPTATPEPTKTVKETPAPVPTKTATPSPTTSTVPPQIISDTPPPKKLPYTGTTATVGGFLAALAVAAGGVITARKFRRR